MSQTLDGRGIIVVGASSGMGRATALALASAGAHVVAAARRMSALEHLTREAAPLGDQIEPCEVDVTQRASVDRLIEFAGQRLPRIDTLIYASGTNLPQRSLKQLSVEGWQSLIDTNLTGAFHCTQAVLPVFREAGGGLLIFISSAAVQHPDVSGAAYQASKHGMKGLAAATRVEERQHGVRVTTLYPGLCDTEILAKRPAPTPTDILQHALQPEDVAAAVQFVCELPERVVVPEMEMLPSRV
ncbi:MAG TPA: SDR family oxidoreductase [Planctomycetaceae bacterium]|nr:SDR family oxidoreductase [Planctomycetaceae bacterium]